MHTTMKYRCHIIALPLLALCLLVSACGTNQAQQDAEAIAGSVMCNGSAQLYLPDRRMIGTITFPPQKLEEAMRQLEQKDFAVESWPETIEITIYDTICWKNWEGVFTALTTMPFSNVHHMLDKDQPLDEANFRTASLRKFYGDPEQFDIADKLYAPAENMKEDQP